MKKSRFTDRKTIQMEVGGVTPVDERCREHAMNDASCYK